MNTAALYVSKNALAMVFLPQTKSRVSKTGLIHLNKLQYLVPSANLFGRRVEVRYDPQDYSKVYVWFEDHYYGEAGLYLPENDYLKRQKLMKRLMEVPEITIPDIAEVPLYGYLERRLAAHPFMNNRINDALKRLQQLLSTREIGVVIGEAGTGKSTLLEFRHGIQYPLPGHSLTHTTV